MNCQTCKSDRVVLVDGKTSDMCGVNINDKTAHGYVPSDMGIGGGDYLRFELCLNCGQVQGEFPLPQTELESDDING